MTTHYEKIQALGNRMASNLETMGVSASFSDGGLTLADKILQIHHFTDGLLLWADKGIIQIDDTVNVYALLLDERKAVSGETILFKGLETTQTLVANTETSVGNQYRFTNLPSSSSDWGGGKVYLNEEQTVYLRYSIYGFDLITPTQQKTISSNISIENGIITCYGAQTGNKQTVDISSTNTNKITSTISDVTIAETMQGTTGSDGVATVGYTGKGTGKLNIQAYDPERIISSGIYEIFDCLKYDNATITDHNDSMWESIAQISRGEEYSTITDTTTSTGYISITSDVIIEADVSTTMGSNGTVIVIRSQSANIKTISVNNCQMTSNTWKHLKVIIRNNKLTIEDTLITDEDITDYAYFILRASANYQTKFKNVKVYSI